MGPSGSGKSTLAHCINALIPCSIPGDITGELTVAGLHPQEAGVAGMAKKVGTVLQDTDGQFIGLTVGEDLAFALENDMVPHEEMHRRVAEVADTVQLTPFLDDPPGALSGGQKQRVSMGGVLVDDVEILVFDEPLANLDPATGKSTIELIDRLCRERHTTVLIVEHRLEDVLHCDVDRIIVVGEGRIVCDLAPDALLCGDTLERQGIREPLYLTAVKHAMGTTGSIRPEDHPQHIDTMNLEPYRSAVTEWYQKMPERTASAKGDPLLEVRNLTFRYDAFSRTVLKQVSCTICRGELVSLVGKNGAGKSTLASLICGFYKIQPGCGSILLDGRDISPLSIMERGERIGLVMQNPNQMISKPMIMEEVGLGLTVRGMPEEEVHTRTEQALKICGLYPYRHWPIGALSFGQKKRVTIASILVMEPELLILDEPTAGQDYRHYTEIMEFLKQLHDQTGLTMLMITHDMHLMLEYTDRVLVLADGELLKDTKPSDVLTDPATAAAACLKETSLYALALRCGIDDPAAFTERFIQYERSIGHQHGWQT